MRFDTLSAGARAVWAKSAEPKGHGLLAHLLDVAAVAQKILAREPPAALQVACKSFGLDACTAIQTLAAVVGLHDLGKAIPGFQCKWPAGRAAAEAAGLSFPPFSLAADRHDLASARELRATCWLIRPKSKSIWNA